MGFKSHSDSNPNPDSDWDLHPNGASDSDQICDEMNLDVAMGSARLMNRQDMSDSKLYREKDERQKATYKTGPGKGHAKKVAYEQLQSGDGRTISTRA